jgi:hypothetical protein
MNLKLLRRAPRHLMGGTFAVLPLLALALYANPNKHLYIASSPEEPALVMRIKGLSSTVSLDDARRVTYCAVTSGLELAREWHVSSVSRWLPGLQNLYIKMGTRKGGYCFQYCAELLVKLEAMKLQTVEFHWGESQPGKMSENNAIIVTARGQPFREGVLLDNWRAQGHLAWTVVTEDPEYHWKENKSFAALVLQKANNPAPEKPAPTSSPAESRDVSPTPSP